jgi:hypothetical protein
VNCIADISESLTFFHQTLMPAYDVWLYSTGPQAMKTGHFGSSSDSL